MLFACTGYKEEPVQPEERSVTLTGVIGLDSGSPQTRALTERGKKFFAQGDRIAVVYTNNSDVTVKAESEPLTAGDIYNYGKKAIIRVTLTDPKPEGALSYIYPASMAKADGSVNYDALDNQDGTLASLSSDLDFCSYSGNLTSSATLPEDANLSNGFTILKISVINAGIDITDTLTDISATDGTDTYTVTWSGASSPLYVVMKAVPKDKTIGFTAHDGNPDYYFFKNITGKRLLAGHFYPINLTLHRYIDLSALTAPFQARKDDWLAGVLGNNVQISIQDGANVTLGDADINGAGTWTTGDYAGVTCAGSAAITLDGTNNVKGFDPAYPGIFVPSGKTLTIKGSGALTAASNAGTGAGIGAGSAACGNVTITGDTITATGGTGAAGIGASAAATAGNINISGNCVVDATGGTDAAGIGAGNAKNCGTIVISGGTVTARGGDNGAGIGGARSSVSGRMDIKTGISMVKGIKGTGAKDGIGRGTAKNGDVYFNSTRRYRSDGSNDSWSPNPMKNGTYDGFNFTITTTTNTNDTWTVVPQ